MRREPWNLRWIKHQFGGLESPGVRWDQLRGALSSPYVSYSLDKVSAHHQPPWSPDSAPHRRNFFLLTVPVLGDRRS